MTFGVLSALLSDDFDMSMYCYATPKGLRRRLRQCEEVRTATEALASGRISEETIERFAHFILRDLTPSQKFQHEAALSALVVILEDRPTGFAEAFIKELSELKVLELSLAVGVALEAANFRKSQPHNPGPQAVRLSDGHRVSSKENLIIPGAQNPLKKVDSASKPSFLPQARTA